MFTHMERPRHWNPTFTKQSWKNKRRIEAPIRGSLFTACTKPHNFLNVRASGRIEIRRKLSIDGASKERNDGKYNKRVSKGGHDNNLKWSKWKLFWLEMMEKALDELQIYREKATRMHGGNGQWGEKRPKVSNFAAMEGLLFWINSICVVTLKESWLDKKIKHAWEPTLRTYQKEKKMRPSWEVALIWL